MATPIFRPDMGSSPELAFQDLVAWADRLTLDTLPRGLRWLLRRDDPQAWLDSLPEILQTCAETWDLSFGQPLYGGTTSLVVEARLANGTEAVLKVQYPDREVANEAAALIAWGGSGAVRLLDHDSKLHVLLLERCVPGMKLSMFGGSADAVIDALVDLVPRLWVAPRPPFDNLKDEAAFWVTRITNEWDTERPWDKRVRDAAIDALESLGPTQGEQVLLNQDLHGDNILSSDRAPWLVIDPKPLIGERDFSVAPIVRSYELGHTRAAVVHRLDRLTSDLGLDRERTRLWAIGQTLAWSRWSKYRWAYVQTVRWLMDA